MNLLERDTVINSLQRSMSSASFGLSNVPDLLQVILEEGAWKERSLHQNGQKAQFQTFAEFVEAPLIRGLASSVGQIKNLCRDNIVVIDLIDQALQNPVGAHIDNSNISTAPNGTTRDSALRRLRKSRPDLHTQVLKGGISAHSAMIEAGFRRKTITVALEPQKAAETLKRHFSDTEIVQLVAYLVSE